MSGCKVPPEIAELVLELVHNQMKQIKETVRKEVELIEAEKRDRESITPNHKKGNT